MPDVVISKSVSERMGNSFNLTCEGTASGCHATAVGWSDRDGIKISTTVEHRIKSRLASILVVNNSSFERQFACTVNYTGGSVRRDYGYTG